MVYNTVIMNKNNKNIIIAENELKSAIEQSREVCIWALKLFDEEYRTRKKFIPYSQITLERLLFYIPALVTDGDLTEKEGKRITVLIRKRLSFLSQGKTQN